jgi:TATA-box binding protein (TBP) (component of TFIID and TFIIIB)
MVKFKVVRLCKDEAVSIVPTQMLRYDLDGAAKLLEQNGYQVLSQGLMVIAKGPGHEVTLYASGRMLLSGVKDKEKAGEVAGEVYAKVEGSLEPSTAKRS